MRKTLIALALIAGLAGCGDDTEEGTANPAAPDAPPATIALVTATANPVFVSPVATGDPDFPWSISWVTTVRETAGVAAQVNRINVVLVDVKAVYERIYNPQAAIPCGNMPRLGAAKFLTIEQIKDLVAFVMSPESPVNK